MDVGVPDGLSVAEPFTPVGDGADGPAGPVVVFDGDAPGVVPVVTVGDGDELVGEVVPADALPGVGSAHAGADKVSPDKVIAAVTAVTVTRPCLSLISPSIWSFRTVVSDPDLVRAADPSQ
ncbi:hypothetical protein [Streptomyces sp. NBC_00328]|uniref:hypothetical protein n=1 Tax=Streptomyces sp. NBC_00328 TaxID=2903646 RepID=UPI002E27E344|nr:hypothetical protein [Streptomyces sp. NBC_00328]